MKKKFAYFVMSLSLALSVVGAPVLAHAVGNASTQTSAETETTARKTRIDDYKKLFKDNMTTAIKARVVERCVAAQALVAVKTTNNDKATTLRSQAYDQIVANLKALSTKLAADKIDVTTLDANIAVLETKVAAFKTANTAFHQALTDLAALDCKADPTAFKAALEAARTDQIAVFTAAKDVRTYLVQTVKATLKALQTAVDTSKTSTPAQ